MVGGGGGGGRAPPASPPLVSLSRLTEEKQAYCRVYDIFFVVTTWKLVYKVLFVYKKTLQPFWNAHFLGRAPNTVTHNKRV